MAVILVHFLFSPLTPHPTTRTFTHYIDIGLSGQDCVEMRRYFRIPPAIQAKTKSVPFTSTYLWNDRDCNEKNFFLCERPISDGKCVTQNPY